MLMDVSCPIREWGHTIAMVTQSLVCDTSHDSLSIISEVEGSETLCWQKTKQNDIQTEVHL